jgi:hypothetical protein
VISFSSAFRYIRSHRIFRNNDDFEIFGVTEYFERLDISWLFAFSSAFRYIRSHRIFRNNDDFEIFGVTEYFERWIYHRYLHFPLDFDITEYFETMMISKYSVSPNISKGGYIIVMCIFFRNNDGFEIFGVTEYFERWIHHRDFHFLFV